MKTNHFIVYATGALLLFGACSKKDTPEEEPPIVVAPEEGNFIIAALPYRSTIFGGADILYTSATLDDGTLVTEGKGIEQDGSNRNYLTANGKFFSFLFGQAAAGAVTVYSFDSQGVLNKLSNFQSETMTARGAVGEDVLMIKNAWEPAQSYSQWYKANTNTMQLTGNGEINTNTLSGNGEMALFTGITQVGDKVFAPFLSMKTGRSFATSYRDSSWIAVYSYPAMQLEKVIRDNRTGFIGSYFGNGLEVDENGDVYAMATSLGADGAARSTKPAGFMRIKKGTTAYDQSYFFNITEASEGHFLFRKLYLGKGNFLLMLSDTFNTYATSPTKFAIANVYTKSFKWVTGLPAQVVNVSQYSSNYSPLDGKTGYVGIAGTSDGETIISAVYKFDAETATAKIGLQFAPTTDLMKANIISSINWAPIRK